MSWIKTFLCFVLFFKTCVLCAQSAENAQVYRKRLLFGYSKNYPILKSRNTYEPSLYHPILGLRFVKDDWILGASVQFKFVKEKNTGILLPLWTLQEEFNYRFRLYHPLYLLAGGKFLYLYPVQKGVYPFHKREDLGGAEIGVAATTSLLYELPKNFAIGVFVDLWRGTGSRRYQGFETGIHLICPLSF